MKELLDKLSSYNIFNYLFPSTIFCFLNKEVTGYRMMFNDIITGVFFYYFIGLIISRVGSIVIEPIFKKLKIVEFSDYSDYIIAEKNDPKIEVLSENNNMFRTLISLVFVSIIIKIYFLFETKYSIVLNCRWIVISLVLLVLFVLSYKKQTKYITKRINSNIKEKNQ